LTGQVQRLNPPKYRRQWQPERPFTFNWVIPNIPGITTTKAKMRVIDASDPTVYDTSIENFTIKAA